MRLRLFLALLIVGVLILVLAGVVRDLLVGKPGTRLRPT